MPDVGYPSRVRETVSKGRSGGNGDFETDPLRNLAYVVSSANDNITALQRTVKQQEKDLCTKTDQIASLQRNYETLSRIRQADQSEFMLLKGLHEEQQAALAEAHVALAAERERVGELRAELSAGEQERAELPELRARAAELERGKAEAEAAAEAERARAAEQSEATKRLQLQVEKLGRAQAETLARASQMDETCARLQQEKAAAEQGRVSAGSKLAVQERQLRTFLEANEALEADLREQMSRVAALERRHSEQEAEKATIEAYYEARLAEMQAQYERVLTELDESKAANRAGALAKDAGAQATATAALHTTGPAAEG